MFHLEKIPVNLENKHCCISPETTAKHAVASAALQEIYLVLVHLHYRTLIVDSKLELNVNHFVIHITISFSQNPKPA